MTLVLLSGGFTFAIGMLILRPFSITGGRLQVRAHTPDGDAVESCCANCVISMMTSPPAS